MKHAALVLAGLLSMLTGLWLAVQPFAAASADFAALRDALIQYSGILSIGVMSVALVRANRPVVIEPFLGGLDKMYRLHKWLGVTALVTTLSHCLLIQVPGWLIDLGWLARPAKPVRTMPGDAVFPFFQNQRGLAKGLGEWAFYSAVVLIVLALVKWFPYRYFFKVHHLMAVAYLALVFHALMLMPFSYWAEAIAPWTAALMVVGSVAALRILFNRVGRVGRGRRAVGMVEEVTFHEDLRSLEVAVRLKSCWRGHDAGQFALVTFNEKEGPHPFTISSAWTQDGRLRFIVKGLGDYTKLLPDAVKVGGLVKVEGPYGQFSFSSARKRQIWVSGGIGITPFIARMKQLALQTDGKLIDLFHSSAEIDEAVFSQLRLDAEKAHLHLHLLVDGRDSRLTAQGMAHATPQWRDADVWFCGPAGFGQSLWRDLHAMGLARGDFHQELFNLR